jgi:hypothetical protein
MVKLSLKQAVKAHRVVRSGDSHIFYTIGSHIAVRFISLTRRLPFTPRKISGTHFS